MKFWKLPKVLVIHLKRFKHLEKYNYKQKKNNEIEFPE